MVEQSIFISYRREDTADVAGRVYDRLVAEFGRSAVFKDVDDLPIGSDFGTQIRGVLSRCMVVLALIGPVWATIRDGAGNRRLDAADDWVRIEIESAIESGVQVIPVLVNGAGMPIATHLPTGLQKLASLNAANIRRDPDFHKDMSALCSVLVSLGLAPNTDVSISLRSEKPQRVPSAAHPMDRYQPRFDAINLEQKRLFRTATEYPKVEIERMRSTIVALESEIAADTALDGWWRNFTTDGVEAEYSNLEMFEQRMRDKFG